jgi:gamma-glutamylcyclotransferase (GGCT)/AIG2-like uncharacterized protein YtfP
VTKLLVYGTLRQNCGASGFLNGTDYQGDVRLPGYDMYNLGGFPGIVPNPDNKEGVVCEVFDGVTPEIMENLDYYEGYRPDYPPERSHYLRKKVEVRGEPMFVYVFNRPTDLGWHVPIKTGDWKDR